MGLRFQNSFPATIELTFVLYDETCGVYANGKGGAYIPNTPWRKCGWFILQSGETVQVMNGDLAPGNRYYYAFARQVGGGAIWAGPLTFPVCDTVSFNRALWDNAGCDINVGLFEIDVNGYDTYTLNFVP